MRARSLLLFAAAVSACKASPRPRGGEVAALARPQDPGSLEALARTLDDPRPGSRAAAAFAIGQIGASWDPPPDETRARGAAVLTRRLGLERDPAVRDRLVEALGKVGGPRAADELVALLGLAGPERGRAAIALGVLARSSKGALARPAALPALGRLLEDPIEEVRWAAAYGLAQQKNPQARAALARCTRDPAALVRAICAKGLGEAGVGTAAEVPALARLLPDADGRTAAEAGRSLARLATRCGPGEPCPALTALDRSAALVRPEVLEALVFEPIVHPAAAQLYRARYEVLEQPAGPAATQLDRRTRGLLQCKAALGHDRARGTLQLLPRCGLGVVDEAWRGMLSARALGQAQGQPAERLAALRPLARRPEPAVRAAAAEALAGIDLVGAAEALLELLGDREPAVVGAAAEAVGRRKLASATSRLRAQIEPLRRRGADGVESLEAVIGALGTIGAKDAVPDLRRLLVGSPYAVGLAAAQALEALGAGKTRFRPAPPPAPPSASAALPPDPVVELRTTRGRIVVRLDTAQAPATARNFLALVERHFYDGLLFHRVVPDFVSQGGDPKGDGSGGPGYAIACEINPHRYGMGTLGMALAGKDTGGSQFFFAHAPQPHLDGRYTAFGEIVEGAEVPLAMVEGDRILTARVLSATR